MHSSIKILFFVTCVCSATSQSNSSDDRYAHLLLPVPIYLGTGYASTSNHSHHNSPVNINTKLNLNTDGLVEEFGQCGGLDWTGPSSCQPTFICVKRSKYYSQCLSSESAANLSRSAPQLIPAGGTCHGRHIRDAIVCATGTACFIQTEHSHGECRADCPPGWFCVQQTLPEWAPCGGEAYVGLTKCKEGLQCLMHSKWYYECRSECPAGWQC